LSHNDFVSWYRHAYIDNERLDPVKQAILFTVLAFGSKDDKNGAGEAYFSHAIPTVGIIIERGGLEAIQALVLMVHPVKILTCRVCFRCMRLVGLVRGFMLVLLFE
jgi:hypothetical protein